MNIVRALLFAVLFLSSIALMACGGSGDDERNAADGPAEISGASDPLGAIGSYMADLEARDYEGACDRLMPYARNYLDFKSDKGAELSEYDAQIRREELGLGEGEESSCTDPEIHGKSWLNPEEVDYSVRLACLKEGRDKASARFACGFSTVDGAGHNNLTFYLTKVGDSWYLEGTPTFT